jgi:hypothetical protein
MNPRTHESLNAFSLDLDLIDISEFVLVGTGFIGGKLRVRVGRHPSPPFLFNAHHFIANSLSTLSIQSME